MKARMLISLILVLCLLTSVFSVNAFAGTVTPFDAPESETAAEPTTAEEGEAASANGDGGELRVTKSPTGESIEVGGNALFISAAENYSDFEWRVTSADGSQCWRGEKEIENRFAPVKFTVFQDDDDRECLFLDDIPETMDGYYIQTKFWSIDGSETVFTDSYSCLITVNRSELKLPVVEENPQGVELESGKSTVLTVKASSPDGNELKYQWFKNTANSTVGATEIPGATSAEYTPEELEGTYYYYCALVNTDGTDTSATELSKVAAVRYLPKPVEMTPVPENTPIPAAEIVNPDQDQRIPPDKIIILLIIIAVLMLALIAAIIYLLAKGRGDDEETGEDKCSCAKCGWQPADADDVPKYCPVCGEPMDAHVKL